MTDYRIVYQDGMDTPAAIITPMPEYVAHLMARGMTEIEAVEAIATADVPAHVNARAILTIDQIPRDRTFRNAWRLKI